MVMVRDVSQAVRIADEPRVITSFVLDVDTGLVLGIGAASSAAEACHSAFDSAVNKRGAGVPFDPGPPARVLCAREHLEDVTDQLDAVVGAAAPAPEEVIPGPDAEDIVDSFVGHMAGRAQPDDSPTPDDWRQLVTLTHDYAMAEPWTLPHLTEPDLDLLVTVDGAATRYVPVVLGRDGIQHGLVLYPGAVLPDSLLSWRPGQPATVPPGSVMCYLDPPDERAPEAIGRSARYGWPDDAPLAPLYGAASGDGRPADISRTDARRLALAMTAVLHAGDEWAGHPPSRISGRLALADGGEDTYTLGVQPARPGADQLIAVIDDAVREGDPYGLSDPLAGSGGVDPFSAAGPSRRRPRRDDVVTYRVRVDLKDAKPPVWRRLELASDLRLDELHEILQACFGWYDAHLHQFGAGPTSFYHPETERFVNEYTDEDGEVGVYEADVRLDEVLTETGDRLFYVYDFGDNWEHVVKLEAVLPRDHRRPRAICTKGRRPGPAEDSGGVWAYNLISAATDPSNKHHRDALDELAYTFGTDVDLDQMRPIPFDIDEVNASLADRLK